MKDERILVRKEKRRTKFTRVLNGKTISQHTRTSIAYTMKCLRCGKNFKIPTRRFNQGRGKFCSMKCCYTSDGHRAKQLKKYQFKRGHQAWWKKYPGKKAPSWKGLPVKDANGYLLIWKPEHPLSHQHGYILQHRLVVEQKLGRYLKPEEVVHHVNGIKDDNHPENLINFPNEATHKAFEKYGKDLIYFPKGYLLDNEEVWLRSNELVKLLT